MADFLDSEAESDVSVVTIIRKMYAIRKTVLTA